MGNSEIVLITINRKSLMLDWTMSLERGSHDIGLWNQMVWYVVAAVIAYLCLPTITVVLFRVFRFQYTLFNLVMFIMGI